ncbi:hypothetical protein CMI37_10720 [Candidatus Pacearchaeota archaeon]|nr:hypothetical protein [Candidatus Pacearchaeota archaeon]|tara:strand:+ start:1162 stop:1449 length:288 start_codon:yes stop_codon:yes gene_type:complete
MPKTIEQYREEFEDAHRGAGDLLERLWEMWVEQFHPTLVGLELIDPQWAPTPQPVIDRVGWAPVLLKVPTVHAAFWRRVRKHGLTNRLSRELSTW